MTGGITVTGAIARVRAFTVGDHDFPRQPGVRPRARLMYPRIGDLVVEASSFRGYDPAGVGWFRAAVFIRDGEAVRSPDALRSPEPDRWLVEPLAAPGRVVLWDNATFYAVPELDAWGGVREAGSAAALRYWTVRPEYDAEQEALRAHEGSQAGGWRWRDPPEWRDQGWWQDEFPTLKARSTSA